MAESASRPLRQVLPSLSHHRSAAKVNYTAIWPAAMLAAPVCIRTNSPAAECVHLPALAAEHASHTTGHVYGAAGGGG